MPTAMRVAADTPGGVEPPSGMSDTAAIRDYLLHLWRARLPIAAACIVLGVAAAVYTATRPRLYEASATVSVSASRLNNQTGAFFVTDPFVPLMLSRSVAASVVTGLALPMAPADLLDQHITVRGIPNSSLIKVVAWFDTPDMAASVANRFADEAVNAASKVSRIDVESMESDLKRMVDEATTRLRGAEKAYDDYRATAKLEMVEREVETLVQQRSDLMEVIVDLEAERARLVRFEGDLSKLTPVTSLRQAVVDEPALSEAARAGNPSSKGLLGVEMTREMPNATYANLEEAASKTRAQVAFLEQRRQRLAAATGVSGSQLARMTQLYQHQSMLDRLESEREIARRSYEDIAEAYQKTRLNAIGRAPQLLVVDRASAPDRPLGRYLVRNVMLGLLSGALLGVVVTLARAIFSSRPS